MRMPDDPRMQALAHQVEANRPTPDPSQEGNIALCAFPLLGGARGGLWVQCAELSLEEFTSHSFITMMESRHG